MTSDAGLPQLFAARLIRLSRSPSVLKAFVREVRSASSYQSKGMRNVTLASSNRREPAINRKDAAYAVAGIL